MKNHLFHNKTQHLTTNIHHKRNKVYFSASFFAILLAIVFLMINTGCKKQDFANGKDSLNSIYGVNSKLVDTFNLITYSVLEDSIRVKNNSHVLFGSYNDPIFGKVKSDIYTNILLDNPGVINFTANPIVDSVVLSLQYNGYYGTPQDINVEVYQLTDLMDINDTLYQFSSFNHDNTNLVESGHGLINANPVNKTVVGTDTLDPQMRIRLDVSLGNYLIAGASQGVYDTQDAFKNYFKGLYIKTTDVNLPKGKGAMYYFSMTAKNSGLTIYYRDADNVAKSFQYIINNKGVYFNHVDIDRTGTKVQQLLSDSTLGQREFYAQAYGIRSVVEIPGLKELPKGAIIHSAQLVLPFTSYYLDKFYPSATVTIGYYDKNNYKKPVVIKRGNLYNQALKAYVIDLNDFSNKIIVAQEIIDQNIDTRKFYIIPDNYANSAERIIFNGKNTLYKGKPKLTVIYTLN